MTRSVAGVIVILLLAGCGLLLWHLGSGEPATGPPGGKGEPLPPNSDKPLTLTTSASCRECHPEVYREWYASQHRVSYTNKEVQKLSDGFKDKDCLPCHLPQPLLETGLGMRVLERLIRHEEGVGCITCHKYKNAMLGTREPGPGADDAPCNPRQYPPVGDTKLCAPCHDQHKVHVDWTRTRFAVPGPDYKDCNDCHMPVVDRRMPDGSVREGRSHLLAGGHVPDMVAKAVTVTTREVGEHVIVEVRNDGAGHHFPADYRHRAADLQLQLSDGKGWSAPVRVDRYRNPYRDEFHLKNPLPEPGSERTYTVVAEGVGTVKVHAVRVPADFNPDREPHYPDNTQIPAGEARSYTFTLPSDARRVRVRLWYRLTPYSTDEESTLVYEEVLEVAR